DLGLRFQHPPAPHLINANLDAVAWHLLPVVLTPSIDVVIGADDPRAAVAADADVLRFAWQFLEGAVHHAPDLVARIDDPGVAVGLEGDANAVAVDRRPSFAV